MKESEKLRELSSMEENDIKAFGILCKALREKRSEKFAEDWLEPLQMIYPVELRKNGSYSITTQKYGILDYWPKANKLLMRSKNKWIKPGLRWMIKNIIQ